ncbi:hypothetical protein RHMOL_Rhmol05G0171400 [Rhododendron molle]|uniref:Uncharacterized protein n=1 Tax=Rhododendron molle TaxID=49168 RepID=A0ACC0NQ26_RHOML|nr:hypothetical protein RHMOL_Rhmol05G0171400 [Rhododendron molle]
MSERLKNYPSPMEVINDYGADALRLYIINSPVVRPEPLRFIKDGVFGVNAKRLEVEGLAPFIPVDKVTLQQSSNVLDQWINPATLSLVHFVQQEMNGYRLYTETVAQGVTGAVWFLLCAPLVLCVGFNYARMRRIGDLFVMWPADCCVAFSFRLADRYVADVEAREPISSRSHGIMRIEEIGGAKIAEIDLIAERFLPRYDLWQCKDT